MSPWSSLALSVAVSLDSLGVGVAYGARGIRIPWPSLLVIGLCTGTLMTASMCAGQLLVKGLALKKATTLGGSLLVFIGTWQLVQGWRHYVNRLHPGDPARPLLHLRIPVLGLAIQVLCDPAQADVNRSGTIDMRESFLLGGALGLDAFGAGFGASMAGFPLWIVPLVSASCVAFVFLGSWVGNRTLAAWLGRKGFALPGLLLIALGVWQL